MSDERPQRPLSHRAPPGAGDMARRLVPPLTAVTAVVLVIVLLLLLNSHPTHVNGVGPAVVAAPTSTSPSTSPSPTHSRTSSRSAAPPPVTEPPATATPAAMKAPVTVLNNSRISGLAHHAAAQVARGGWTIAAIGNFTGRIAESTIYYAHGQQRIAEAFARQFPGVRRVLPRFAGLPGKGLTLVVTRDWPE